MLQEANLQVLKFLFSWHLYLKVNVKVAVKA